MDPSAQSRPPASEIRKTVTTTESWFGSWHHLVLTKSVGTVALYLDGAPPIQSKICTSASPGVCDIFFPLCGAIPAKSIVQFPSGMMCGSISASQAHLTEPIPFVIGAAQDRGSQKYQSHYGYIKSVRILSKSLKSAEVGKLYALNTALVESGQISTTTYWVGSSGELLTPSPSQRHCDVTACPDITVLGKFQLSKEYMCRWKVKDNFTDWAASLSNLIGTCASQKGTCDSNFANKLVCQAQNPVWTFGYKAVTLTIVERNSEWSTLWQRTCLQASCGYTTYDSLSQRKDSAALWWLYWGSGAGTSSTSLYFGLNRGALTLFTFQTTSSLLFFSDDQLLSNLSIPSSLGASRSVYFESNGSYLAVANYWDGRTTKTLSTILSLEGTGMTLVQSFPTFAATGWKYFSMNGRQFLSIANYESNSSIFR